MSWTKEPWGSVHFEKSGSSVILPERDYVRARNCVNACTSLKDPEKEIKALVEAARDMAVDFMFLLKQVKGEIVFDYSPSLMEKVSLNLESAIEPFKDLCEK